MCTLEITWLGTSTQRQRKDIISGALRLYNGSYACAAMLEHMYQDIFARVFELGQHLGETNPMIGSYQLGHLLPN